jgi:hypothetical protein
MAILMAVAMADGMADSDTDIDMIADGRWRMADIDGG